MIFSQYLAINTWRLVLIRFQILCYRYISVYTLDIVINSVCACVPCFVYMNACGSIEYGWYR